MKFEEEFEFDVFDNFLLIFENEFETRILSAWINEITYDGEIFYYKIYIPDGISKFKITDKDFHEIIENNTRVYNIDYKNPHITYPHGDKNYYIDFDRKEYEENLKEITKNYFYFYFLKSPKDYSELDLIDVADIYNNSGE